MKDFANATKEQIEYHVLMHITMHDLWVHSLDAKRGNDKWVVNVAISYCGSNAAITLDTVNIYDSGEMHYKYCHPYMYKYSFKYNSLCQGTDFKDFCKYCVNMFSMEMK